MHQPGRRWLVASGRVSWHKARRQMHGIAMNPLTPAGVDARPPALPADDTRKPALGGLSGFHLTVRRVLRGSGVTAG
jgi:hypothetical protein